MSTELMTREKLFLMDPKGVKEWILNSEGYDLNNLLVTSDASMWTRILDFAGADGIAKLIEFISPQELGRFMEKFEISQIANFLTLMSPNRLAVLGVFLSDRLILSIAESGLPLENVELLISEMQRERYANWKNYFDVKRSLSKFRVENLESASVDDALGITNVKTSSRKQTGEAYKFLDSFRHSILFPSDQKWRSGNERLSLESPNSNQMAIEENLHQRQADLNLKEAELAKRLAEIEEANKELVQKRIEQKVPEYVTFSIAGLELSTQQYKKKAFWWSIFGSFILFAAVVVTIGIAIFGSGVFGKTEQEISWPMMLFIAFKGLIVLGVLSLWAKHAFAVSNAYIHEAIKRSDRAHAINFGKLYLEIYGSTVERKELLDIFENWNIATESAFSKAAPSEFDPKAFEKFVDVAKMLNPVKSEKP
ncbi:hypothetical protein ACO0LF_13160 [Undibacterium sp. Di27W]|uniref:hypothetical protein n=1 Tax=Undibacterium sp. Di27W TaxID=3413036 RepID=UPI003BEFE399